jgi:uncharacterized protein
VQGQKLNLDEIGSGTNYSARDVFKRLGIRIQEVNTTQTDAFEKLKGGEIAGTVLIAGKPARSIAIPRLAHGLHFLAIPYVATLG